MTPWFEDLLPLLIGLVLFGSYKIWELARWHKLEGKVTDRSDDSATIKFRNFDGEVVEFTQPTDDESWLFKSKTVPVYVHKKTGTPKAKQIALKYQISLACLAVILWLVTTYL